MSLRAFLTTAMILLGALALAVVAALVVLTSWMHRATASLVEAANGVRAAEELQIGLLSYSRVRAIAALTGIDVSEGGPERLEADLQGRFSDARALAANEDERALVDAARGSFEQYLATVKGDESGTDAAATQVASSEIHAALASLDRLIELNVAQARAANARVARWDALSNVLGLGAGLALLLGVGAVVLWARASIRPVLSIGAAMGQFAAGDRKARVRERGAGEVRAIARQFNEMASELERRQEEQVAFLAGVAHDLRNPLSALRLSAARVPPGRPLPPEDKLRATVGVVNRQIERLDRMVGDLLDATRIEAGQLDLRLSDADARELARAVVDLFASSSDKHTIVLDQPPQPVPTRCDPTRIEQVLTNLVSNAIKYSPEGGEVRVTVRADGDDVLLAVRDQGIGIAPEDRERIFDPFRRTRAARDSFAGAGLGLSVARRIVAAHDGEVRVESAPGEGSTFTVRLPAARPHAHPAPAPSSQA